MTAWWQWYALFNFAAVQFAEAIFYYCLLMPLDSTVTTVPCCGAGRGDEEKKHWKINKLIIKKLCFCIYMCLYVRINDVWPLNLQHLVVTLLWPCDLHNAWRFLSRRLSTQYVSSPNIFLQLIPHRFHSRLQHNVLCLIVMSPVHNKRTTGFIRQGLL